MTITKIEENITNLMIEFDKDNFLFELLLSYGFPKATIARHKKGELNQLEQKGEFTIRKKLLFKVADSDELHGTIDTLHSESKTSKTPPRFIIVTDYKTLLSVDTKTEDTLDIELLDLTKHYDFFLPWAGMEKAQLVDENPADVKAAQKLAKLYDEIIKENKIEDEDDVHSLNVFLTRLLFCYFAEDSNIFAENKFTNAMKQHTKDDGFDLDSYLMRLFEVLDSEKRADDLPEYFKVFPYVNGGLFQKRCKIPKFTSKSRRIMIEIGTLDWSAINPDIFGSMIQAVVTDEYRGDKGMHYTSVPNIMKVIEPLFLDGFYEEFEKSKNSRKKLQALHERLSNLKIFDPACGSGNFLIIAYKELRKLEIKILKLLSGMSDKKQLEFDLHPKIEQQSFIFLLSEIKLSQFYGIELDDFAHEVAKLSLWLAEHQMNVEFFKELGQTNPPLPLKDGGNIIHGNATRLDWEEVCPKEDGDEIYVLGNPPYLGARLQSREQKEDMKFVFDGIKGYNNLDYIACWFYKGAKYIQGHDAKFAFVSTNSISQGEQVGILWKHIFDKNLEIFFAHQSFKWKNNAKGNAGVTVAIIGLRNISNDNKYLFINSVKQDVKNINAYLVNADNIIASRRTKPLSNLPNMSFGNMPNDGGGLILSDGEKNKLVQEFPESNKFIRKLFGSNEFIKGTTRWCLWIKNEDLEDALKVPFIVTRIEYTKKHRLNSKDKGTQKLASRSHQFRDLNESKKLSIIVPSVSSERRKYIPCGFIQNDEVISNSAQAIYDPEPWVIGVITSYIHMLWIRAVGGKLETRIRYSKDVCYNTFPFPNISEKQKEMLIEHTFNILEEREKHSEKTLAELYDPDKMPEGLKKAHHELDLAIERCYRNKPFESDEERLEYLFRLYEEMIKKEGK
jgi:hypothetical protein